MFVFYKKKFNHVCIMFTYSSVSLSKDSNGSNLSTDTLPRAPHVSQAIVRVEYGPGNAKFAPKKKGCKPCVSLVQTKLPCVNLVQTKLLGKFSCERERFHVNNFSGTDGY